MRRHLWFLLIDLLLISVATIGALVIRDNLEIIPERFILMAPYMGVTLCVATPVLLALRLNRVIWRMTTLVDYGRATIATFIIVFSSVAINFTFSRLEVVPRSLPVLQGILILFLLVGMRVLVRQLYAARQSRLAVLPATPETLAAIPGASETVLVVGLNRITELYLASVAEFAFERIRIAGLLGRDDRHTGRLVQLQSVLGTPEDVMDVLKTLDVHGVYVTRIVVTTAFESLSPEAQEALLEIERTSNIKLELFAEWTRLDMTPQKMSQADDSRVFTFGVAEIEAIQKRPYWRLKRAFDFTLAAFLSIALSPVILFVAILVALDLGMDISFWQQRPGLGGRPFKLHKLRTMASAHDGRGRRLSDEERLSGMGRFLRRTRLDELPQLYNILVGNMSFVGPRPLLPVDQPSAYAARLLVRPGLTGWAQVMGGRTISAADKAALDVWYVQNASLMLDLKTMAATVPMVILGERVSRSAIRQAWRELREAGICGSNEILGDNRLAPPRSSKGIGQAA
jgi:lipopolysaccharide/colanic/teichoic acid biosynthesis glycosyltransferase